MLGWLSPAADWASRRNRLWNTGLDRAELMRLARPLGADVPVFIYGQPAFARGIGDVFEPLALPERAYVVVQPHQHVPTESVFSSPDLTRNSACVKIAVFTDWQTENAPRNGFYQNGFFGRNDLEPVVFDRYAPVAKAAKWLGQQGVSARMSGSGACLFAEFVTQSEARFFRAAIFSKIASRANDDAAVIQGAWACPGLLDHPLRHWVRN